MSDAPADGRFHLFEGSMRMPGIAANAALHASAREFFSPRQLGRDGRQRQTIGKGKVLGEFPRIGRTDSGRGVATTSVGSEVWAVEVRSQHTRAGRVHRF